MPTLLIKKVTDFIRLLPLFALRIFPQPLTMIIMTANEVKLANTFRISIMLTKLQGAW